MVSRNLDSWEPQLPASAKRVEHRPFERGSRPYTLASWKNGPANYLPRGEVRSIRAGRACDLLSSEQSAVSQPRETLESRSQNSPVSQSQTSTRDVNYFRYSVLPRKSQRYGQWTLAVVTDVYYLNLQYLPGLSFRIF